MPRWELAAENIVVRIRWFGLFLGYFYVNTAVDAGSRLTLNAILALGAVYTLCDSVSSLRGRVFLGRFPLAVAAMESLFIGLLCFSRGGLDNPFRFYYLLSLICCALRHDARLTYAACALHCTSAAALYFALPPGRREPFELLVTLMLLAWVTWAASSLAWLIKRFGAHVSQLNDALRENQSQLEARIADRTRELQETQAQLLHNEKMAAFGLLAAGIAHEVGNPLTSISSIVQILGRRDLDDYARAKLGLVGDQLQRIQGILRELVTFSRPANNERSRHTLRDVVDEALGIAKYYKGMKSRDITVEAPADLPAITGVRGQLVSIVLNLILNAIDATTRGGQIRIAAGRSVSGVVVRIRDNGAGIDAGELPRLFQPYYTTKANGTGLGLFVSRRLIEQNGGTIECESIRGEGTTFTLTIPVQ